MRQVLLYDTTLRDGMQGQGMSLSAQEKVRVVQKLDELGIHFIEAGFPGSNPKELELFEMLAETAEKNDIPYTIEASGRATHTDADAIEIARAGIPAGLVSIPLRYMHSPVEVVDLGDVEATIELLAAFASTLGPDLDLTR